MKTKRAPVYLQHNCNDGSVTTAATASIGLMHRYGRITPQAPIENPKRFEIHIVPTAVPAPYHPRFLPLVIAGLERTFGTAPPIAEHLYYRGFTKDLEFRFQTRNATQVWTLMRSSQKRRLATSR